VVVGVVAHNAGRRTKFAPVKKLSDLKVFAKSSDLKFGFTVFCPFFSFLKPRKEKPPKRPWGEHLSGCGINVTILHPHEPHLSAMC